MTFPFGPQRLIEDLQRFTACIAPHFLFIEGIPLPALGLHELALHNLLILDWG